MNIVGIIAEYNPFHNGHLYHLKQCKKLAEAEACVVVMSGNFTQRGEPAVFDKWTRSRLAVQCGADLVLELPFAYAVNSAEAFARGGVGILDRLGCVTHIGFGAEHGSLPEMERLAGFLAEETAEFRECFKEFLAEGYSYARARERSVEACLGPDFANLSKTPNNILALEYLKQLKNQKSNIKPIIVNRKGTGYFDARPAGNIASASAIRHTLTAEERKNCVPPQVEEAFACRREVKGYFELIRSLVLRSSSEELSQILSVGEGLENRMKSQVRICRSLEEFVEGIATKRYPKTRIRRILCQMLMGLSSFEDCFYARVLAAGERGKQVIRQIKKQGQIPVFTNINKEASLPEILKYDILAGDIYNILTGMELYRHCDYVTRPYMEKA